MPWALPLKVFIVSFLVYICTTLKVISFHPKRCCCSMLLRFGIDRNRFSLSSYQQFHSISIRWILCVCVCFGCIASCCVCVFFFLFLLFIRSLQHLGTIFAFPFCITPRTNRHAVRMGLSERFGEEKKNGWR